MSERPSPSAHEQQSPAEPASDSGGRVRTVGEAEKGTQALPRLLVTRFGTHRLAPDPSRVITRVFVLPPHRVRTILDRAMAIPDAQVGPLLEQMTERFATRHRDLQAVFRDSFAAMVPPAAQLGDISEPRRQLIGAYFTQEYAIESAALFNPSIVPHPDQAGLPPGSIHFLMSLRATGEGHISSIVFRHGVIDEAGQLSFAPPPEFADSAEPEPRHAYDKELFLRKALRIQPHLGMVRRILDALSDPFYLGELQQVIQEIERKPGTSLEFRAIAADLLWLAEAHYELRLSPDSSPQETVIFPATTYERRGMEDLRLVRFIDEDGQATYYGNYTAFNGDCLFPMVLRTRDFKRFSIAPLSGRYAVNKGHALFPRKVEGKYLMLGRHDGENLYLMRSDSVYLWNESQMLQGPNEPWELVQIGNCGPPIETEAGWLVLTHGVGMMRQYCIGAMLLDLKHPEKVIGRLREPLLVPNAEEREGYVPNVVYTCGAMIHQDKLILPYAVSDAATRFATVDAPALIERLLGSS